MARKLVELHQPEGGSEHALIYSARHRCPQSDALMVALDDDYLDLIFFPVGQVGYTMPRDVPFPVEALEECQACGQLPGCWFVWRAGHTMFEGRLFTPESL